MHNKLVLAALAVSIPVAAQAMSVATFLDKADRLKSRGVAAIFSGDARLLQKELKTSSAALRAERLAAQRAGRRPAYCPPARGQVDSRALLADLRAMPAAERARTEFRDGLRAALARNYPCPA